MKRTSIFFLSLFFIFSINGYSQENDFKAKSERAAREREERVKKYTEQERKIEHALLEVIERLDSLSNNPEKLSKFSNDLKKAGYFNDHPTMVRVELTIRPSGDLARIESLISGFGGRVVEKYSSGTLPYAVVECFLPLEEIRRLAHENSVSFIARVRPAFKHGVTTAGDAQLKAANARAQFNSSGKNVRVGVISDGVANLQNVPSTELANVTVLNTGSGDEGTAMLEIVHDLAPDAILYFRGIGNAPSAASLTSAIQELQTSQCKVIVDDYGPPLSQSMFSEEGPLGDAIRNFIATGGVYITAAGNFHYDFVDPEVDDKRLYAGTASFQFGDWHTFPNGLDYVELTLPGDFHFGIGLQWATRWESPTVDYDLYVFDEEGNNVGSGGLQEQGVFVPPTETVDLVGYQNKPFPQTYRVKIKRKYAASGVDFKLFDFLNGQFDQNYSSDAKIYGHAAHTGVITVAAYPAEDQSQVWIRSSRGPATMYQYNTGQWITQQTPTITATTKVETWIGTNPPGNPYWDGGYPVFGGTSASAPHIAGIAALYFDSEAFPERTREQFIADLKASASAVGNGTAGQWNKEAGWGKANALELMNLAMNRVATPVLSLADGTYGSTQSVTITCATPGATIMYSLSPDGSVAPNTQYTGAIPISQTTVLKAQATAANMLPSLIASGYYTIDPNIPPGSGYLAVTSKIPQDYTAIVQHSENPYYTEHHPNGDSYVGTGTFIGNVTNQKSRAFFQWDLPDNLIPDDAIIQQVAIDFLLANWTTPWPTIKLVRITQDINGEHSTVWNSPGSNVIVTGLDLPGNGWYSVYGASSQFAQQVKNSLVSNIFKIAIVSEAEGTANKHIQLDRSDYPRISIWFTPPDRSVTNKIVLEGTSTTLGGPVAIAGDWGESPFTVTKSWGSNISIEATSGTISNGGDNLKFRTWENGTTLNPRSVKVGNSNNYSAEFLQVYNLTVSNDLEGGGGGQLTYQGSPVNSGYTENDIFRNSERNVTANQTIIWPATNGVEYNFLKWSDGQTNRVHPPITVTSTQTLSAKYKGHLVASTSTAAGSNNQRNIVEASYQANLSKHLVYQSNGSIWYTRNDGSEWTPEFEIGNGRDASISVWEWSYNMVEVNVVWIDADNIVWFRRSMDNGQTWEAARGLFNGDNDARPTVIAGPASCVVWKVMGVLGYKKSPVLYPFGDDGVFEIPNTSNAHSPSIALGFPNTRLVFVQNGQIKYLEFNDPDLYDPYEEPNWGAVQTLSGGSINCDRPTIIPTSIAGNPMYAVAWDEPNGSNRRIAYREKPNGGSWSTTAYFTHSAHVPTRPVIGTMGTPPGVVNLLWQCDNHVARVERLISSSTWSTNVEDLGVGTQPGFQPFTSNATSSTGLWTTGSSAPYTVNVNNISIYQSVGGTIASNTTWSGYYNVTGTVTVSSGVTLTITPGSVITFNGGTSLVVNGKLLANGTSGSKITFTSTGSQIAGSWGNITLSGSGAANSSITHANIRYGNEISVLNGASNVIIQNCTVENVKYGILLNNATGGSVLNNTLTSNTIYHGIRLELGTYTVNYNKVTKVGATGSGAGIQFGTAGGYVYRNDVKGWNWGIACIWGASPDFFNSSGGGRNNRVINCLKGIVVYKDSYPDVGLPVGGFEGNSIYNNTKNVALNTSYTTVSTLYAQTVWWGNDPPNTSLFQIGTTGSVIDYSYWIGYDPWAGIPSGAAQTLPPIYTPSAARSPGSEDEDSFLKGKEMQRWGRLTEAKDFFIAEIAKNPDNRAAYVRLYNSYNEETADDLIAFFSQQQRLPEHKLLLSSLYARQGDTEMARQVNNDLIKAYPNTEVASKAKLNNAYLALYADNDVKEATRLFNEVAGKPQLTNEMELGFVQQAIESHAAILNSETPQLQSAKIATAREIPTEFSLSQNYPNPFNPETHIVYGLPNDAFVTLTVYDILGREVIVLDRSQKTAGVYTARFNGQGLPSGVYFYRISAMEAGGKLFTQTKKMVLAK